VHLRGSFDLKKVSDCIGRALGHPLVALPNGLDDDLRVFQTVCLGLDCQVYTGGHLEDDCGIPFSDYSFIANVRYTSILLEWEDSLSLQILAARVIARSCRRWLGAEYMIVENLQELIESS
jgi:hypothetical protein